MNDSSSKNKGLGRGLNALFDDDEGDSLAVVLGADNGGGSAAGGALGAQMLGIEQLVPGAMQPRMDFDRAPLEELAESIRVHGILQPLLVRQKRDMVSGEVTDEDVYEIIAGERRWRAAQLAQLHEVPVLIRDLDNDQAMQIALIENLQREDLNPVEEAIAYRRLMDEHDYTQAKLADAVGRSRSHIANMVRMLTLPEAVLELVRSQDLSPGHARALITVKNPAPYAEKIIADGMSVRETERYMQAVQGQGSLSGKGKASPAKTSSGKVAENFGSYKDADTLAIEDELSKMFGMKFQIQSKDPSKGGYLRLDFKDMNQLNDALGALQRALSFTPQQQNAIEDAYHAKQQEITDLDAEITQKKARLLD